MRTRYYPAGDIDYDVVYNEKVWPGYIKGLYCKYCSYSNSRFNFKQGKSKSGLGKYNRMRADMVRHIFANHRDIINGKLKEQREEERRTKCQK